MKGPERMRSTLIPIVVLLLITGCSRKTENPRNRILLDAQGNALQAKVLLTELRGGHLTNALELLEQQIDSSIIIMDGSLLKVAAPERDGALGTLRSLKAYREAHPRERQAVIPETDNEEMTRKASRILSELK
jgi:hypothetical protein